MPDEAPDPSPLAFATFDELIEELGRRCNACVIGWDMPDTVGNRRSRVSFTARGPGTMCLGLTNLMRATMTADLLSSAFRMHDEEEEDDDEEE